MSWIGWVLIIVLTLLFVLFAFEVFMVFWDQSPWYRDDSRNHRRGKKNV